MSLLANLYEKINPWVAYQTMKGKVESATMTFKALTTAALGLRPNSWDRYGASNHFVFPRYPYALGSIYELAYLSDILLICQRALKREIFRNGYDVTEAEKTNADTTTSEDDITLEENDPAVEAQRKALMEGLEKINSNNQNVTELMEELEDDLNIIDLMFCLQSFDYEFNSAGAIIKSTFNEAVRMDPVGMSLVMNQRDMFGFDNDDNELLTCPEHRDELTQKAPNTGPHKCPRCGKVMYRAWYRHLYGAKTTFYFENEVQHLSKYRPSKRLGFSPVITVWMKTVTLMEQDKFMFQYYRDKRPPKGILLFGTANEPALRKSWDAMLQQQRENPHLPGILGVPQLPGKEGGNIAQWIDFMRSLDEMQYIPARQESRNIIGAVYGVSPIFQNDVSTSGGLNNEGLQVTVTNRASEDGQALYNVKFLPRLVEAMGFPGWVVKLNPSEEQDEMAEMERENQSLINGQIATNLGLQADYDDDQQKVIIKPGPLTKQESPEGFGGLPDFGTSPNDETDFSGMPPDPERMDTLDLSDKLIIAKAKARPPFTDVSRSIKKEIDKFLKVYKRKPGEKELEKLLFKIQTKMNDGLRRATTRSFDKIYKRSMLDVEKELNVNIEFGSVDQQALEALKNQKLLNNSFTGITNRLSKTVNTILLQAYDTPQGMNIDKIQKEIMDATGAADFHAETIARTETSKVSAAARRNSYKKEDPENEFTYKWIGPNDLRTTGTSKRIKKRVGAGVTYDTLVKIVAQEASKDFPDWTVNPNALVSHYNSRHTHVRAF